LEPEVGGFGDGFSLNPTVVLTGDFSSNTSFAVNNELVLFADSTGKLGKRATGDGIATLTGGRLGSIVDNSTNWNASYVDRMKWDGGSAGLDPVVGRVSLGVTPGTDVEVPLTFTNSVSRAVNTVSLLNDVAAPTGPLAGVAAYYGFDASGVRGFFVLPTGGAGAVSSVFTRTGAVVALVGDYSAFYSQLGHTHTFASLTSPPTTLVGYGITDAQPLDSDLTAIAALTTDSYGRGLLPLTTAAAVRTYISAQIAGSYEVPMTFSKSLVRTANDVALFGDLASVAAGRYYGTSNAGTTRGWFALSDLGGGDFSSNTSTSVIGEVILFSDTGGKIGKRPGVISGIATLASGVLGTTPDNHANWDTAFTQTRQWDGGATGLVAATGRTSLGLGSAAQSNTTAFEVPLTFSQSVARATNTVTLSGDSASPGNRQFYGTNASGTKGYYALTLGTATNDNAAAGSVGETVSSKLASTSAVSTPTATFTNLTSISLTAGDWDVRGHVLTISTAVAATGFFTNQATISTTSASIADDGTQISSTISNPTGATAALGGSLSLTPRRISLASTTTVYLVVRPVSAGTITSYGFIEARRIR
jgi:hypothetical protein